MRDENCCNVQMLKKNVIQNIKKKETKEIGSLFFVLIKVFWGHNYSKSTADYNLTIS